MTGIPTQNRQWVQMPGGYDQATGQAQQQQGHPMQQQMTQLGQPTQQNIQGQPLLPPESQSPLPFIPQLVQQQRQPQPQLQQPQPQFQQVQPQFQQPSFHMQGQQPLTAPVYPQQQVQQPQGVDLNQRVMGANIPPELQGRSVGEIIGIANGLRQVHLQNLQQVQQPPRPVQPVQQQTQQQPQSQQQSTFDWRNPQESIAQVVDQRLNNAIDQRLAPMLAPIALQGQFQQAQQARNQIASEIPGFAQMEPMIIQKLQGINPQALLDPSTWRVAAHATLGEIVARGQGFPQQQQQQMQQQPSYQGAGVYPAQQVQPGQNPMPNLNTFFTEQSMQGGPGVPSGLQLNQAELNAAAAMNMPAAEYAAWKIGVNGGRR